MKAIEALRSRSSFALRTRKLLSIGTSCSRCLKKPRAATLCSKMGATYAAQNTFNYRRSKHPCRAAPHFPEASMKLTFGTLEWSMKSNGVLTRAEKLHFVRNMAFLAVREASDVIRDKLGLLRPVHLNLSDLAPPDTRMVKEAEEFAQATHTNDLLFHGYRTFYFGAILAFYHKLKYDKEIHFTAALLHDIGLTEARAVPLKQCCFAVSGGRQVRDFLIAKEHPAEKAEVIGDAIFAHLKLHLPVDEYGPVAAVVAKGAV